MTGGVERRRRRKKSEVSNGRKKVLTLVGQCPPCVRMYMVTVNKPMTKTTTIIFVTQSTKP